MRPLHTSLYATGIRGLLLGVALILSVSQAEADPLDVDWDDSFVLQGSGGVENPLVQVGFNPCPEPPRGIILSNPELPEITLPAVQFPQILFGIANDGSLRIDATGEPDDGEFSFKVLSETGAPAFDVFFDISTDSGGFPIPGTWVGFNPIPEPPGLASGAASMGFNFEFDSFSDMTLLMEIRDADGNVLSFDEVPEPATLALMSLGLAGIVFSRRRTRH